LIHNLNDALRFTFYPSLAQSAQSTFVSSKEISDEKSFLPQIIEEERVLAIKFQTQKLSITHGLPENLFGVGLTLPQISAKLFGDFS